MMDTQGGKPNPGPEGTISGDDADKSSCNSLPNPLTRMPSKNLKTPDVAWPQDLSTRQS